ncbi:hypothetical protein DLJ49_01815 [Rhodovulum sp. 12E13]|nr:hypothetical protein DLJ49_01815 [Rhodovulum sp. 12E13]
MAESFSVSDEARENYPLLGTPGFLTEGRIENFLEDVYQNLFNRGLDDVGRDFYVPRIESGEIPVEVAIEQIAFGARGLDEVALANKTESALFFTTSLLDVPGFSYVDADGNPIPEAEAAAQAAVATVDETTESVDAAKAATDTFVASVGNAPPVAVDDSGVTTGESAAVTVEGPGVLVNDSDPEGGPLTVTAVEGAASNVGASVTLASGANVTLNADGSYTYDPNGAFDGLNSGQTANDTFTYEIEDEFGATDTATVTVTVQGADNFTVGTDNVTGTAGDDLFTAGLVAIQDGGGVTEKQTLNDSDVADGGDGADRIDIQLNGTPRAGDPFDNPSADITQPLAISNIENFFIQARNVGAQAIDFTNVTGAEQIWNNNSNEVLSVLNVQEVVTIGMIGGFDQGYIVNYGGAVTGDFTQAFVLDNANITNLNVDEGGGNITGLDFTVLGRDVATALSNSLGDVDITSLNIAGDAGLDLTTTLNGLETVESTTTGDVGVLAGNALETATFGEGDDMLTTGGGSLTDTGVSTGAGDDMVVINSNLAEGAAVDLGAGDDELDIGGNFVVGRTADLQGGEGEDILKGDGAMFDDLTDAGNQAVPFEDQIDGFEKLEVNEVAPGEDVVIDLANLDDISYVISNGGPESSDAPVNEREALDPSDADADGGEIIVNGVRITIPNNANAAQIQNLILANEADILAATPGAIDLDDIGSASFIDVVYDSALGDVVNPDVNAGDNPSTVNGNFSEVDGTDGTSEVQTFDSLVPDSSGTFEVLIPDRDGNFTPVSVNVLISDTQPEVRDKVVAAINAAGLPVTAAPDGFDDVEVTWDPEQGAVPDLIEFEGGTAYTNVSEGNLEASVSESTPGVDGTAEVQTLEITSGTDATGGEIVIGDTRIVLGENLTIDQVGGAIVAAGGDIIANNPNVTAVNYNTATSEVTFDFDPLQGDVPPLGFSDNGSGVTFFQGEIEQGNVGTPNGTLTLDNMASGGTFELTGDSFGGVTINVTDATSVGTDDVLNIMLTGPEQLDDADNRIVAAGVETLNITSMFDDPDTDTMDDPTGPSTLTLVAGDAEALNISGNAGVTLVGAGQDLSSVTTIDASGVQAVESGNGDTPGAVGAVGVNSNAYATEGDVTVLFGNGDDFLNGINVGTTDDGTLTADGGAGDDEIIGSGSDDTIDGGTGDDILTGGDGDDVIDGGEGDDLITGGGGADVLTGGAGNDTFILFQGDAALPGADTIVDFQANTVLEDPDNADQGGEVTLADRDGDIIDLSAFGFASIDVEVFSNAADALTFINNGDGDGVGQIALDSSTGRLRIEGTGDNGVPSDVIDLTGVTTIDEAAFLI